MASIHPTPYGTFELKWWENGRQKSKTYKTRAAAERASDEVERRVAEDRPVMRRQDAPTFEEFALDRMAEWKSLEASTRALYAELAATHLFPILGHLSVVDLRRPRRLADWQAQRLGEGAGPAALGKAQTLLGRILKKAVLPFEYLDENPVTYLDAPEYVKRPHRWLTAEEVEAIRRWYLERDDLGSATLVSIQAYVGIRPQDTLARLWTDLGDRLSVTTKNVDGKLLSGSKTGEGYKRTVYVPGPVRDDLESWRLEGSGRGLIIARASDGQPWRKTDYANWRSRPPKGKQGKRPKCFQRATEDVGLGTLKPYDLRHTAASLYAASGWTAVEIAHQLGHSPTESQRTYQHLIHETPPEQRKSIDDYIREARGLAPVVDQEGVRA
jgi:integrase